MRRTIPTLVPEGGSWKVDIEESAPFESGR
jgi:hypothetical protein